MDGRTERDIQGIDEVRTAMMDWDEIRPKPQPAITVGANLTELSVAELEARIDVLKREIERVETELHRKRAQQQTAASLFNE